MPRKKLVSVELTNGQMVEAGTGKPISTDMIKSHSKTNEYRVINANDNDLAVGVHINQYQKTSIGFLQDMVDYKDWSMASVYNQIDISNKMFMFEDVISTGVDILIDFTVTPFEVLGMGDNNKVKEMVTKFLSDVNSHDEFNLSSGLQSLASVIAHEWFISGNVFPGEAWNNVSLPSGDRVKLPTQIELLNPLHIRIDDVTFKSTGKPSLFWTMGSNATGLNTQQDLTRTEDIFRDVKSFSDSVKNNPLFVGEPLLDRIATKGDPLGNVAVKLNSKRISHLKRKARHYNKWGIPYLSKAIQAVTYKQKLWQLDMNTIDGMLNYITIFKIGSDNPNSPYHIVKRKRLTDFQGVLKNPQGSTTIIWPHDIEVITAGPKGEILNFQDKYQEANRAIIQALGVPPILIDGGGNATGAWVAVLALVERMEKIREAIANYCHYMFRKIGQMNGMEEEFSKLTVNWEPINLRNEAEIKNLLLAFYDRGLLPIQTTHTEGGYNHEEIHELKLTEDKADISKYYERPDIPFAANPGQHTMNEGRPVDKSETKDESNVKASALAMANDMLKERLTEHVNNVMQGLQGDVEDLPKFTQQEIATKVLVASVRLAQVMEMFTQATLDGLDVVFAPKVHVFNEQSIDKIKNDLTNALAKLTIKRNNDERDLMIAGVFAKFEKRVELFVQESIKNMNLAKLLYDKQKEEYVGAILNTPEDTKCEYCRAMNGEFMTLVEISDELPFHPHQRFTLNFQKEDLVAAGKMQKSKRKNKTKKY